MHKMRPKGLHFVKHKHTHILHKVNVMHIMHGVIITGRFLFPSL